MVGRELKDQGVCLGLGRQIAKDSSLLKRREVPLNDLGVGEAQAKPGDGPWEALCWANLFSKACDRQGCLVSSSTWTLVLHKTALLCIRLMMDQTSKRTPPMPSSHRLRPCRGTHVLIMHDGSA